MQSPRSPTVAFSAVLAMAALTVRPADAALFANYDAARQERFLTGGFTQNPNFFLRDKYDVSAIAVDRTPTTINATGGVLISPQHVLAAWHFKPGTFTFSGNDGILHDYAVAAGGYTRLNTTFDDGNGNIITRPSDVAIGRLTTPVNPAHGINPMPIVGSDPADFQGHVMYAVGQANQGGSNVMEDDVLAVSRDGSGNITNATHTVMFDFDTVQNGGTNGPLLGEIGLIGGDSGNPALLVADGQLALLGAHFAIDTNMPGPDVNYGSYSSFLGAYLDPLRTLVSGDGQSITVVEVPEPATLSAFLFAGAALLRRRR